MLVDNNIAVAVNIVGTADTCRLLIAGQDQDQENKRFEWGGADFIRKVLHNTAAWHTGGENWLTLAWALPCGIRPDPLNRNSGNMLCAVSDAWWMAPKVCRRQQKLF